MEETTIMHASSHQGRVVYATNDPFPTPRPFQRETGSVRYSVRSRMPRKRFYRGTVAMVAAVALVTLALAGVLGVASTLADDLALSSAQDGSATSTPKSQWKLGEVPYLYQTDGQWADAEYAGGTVAANGCGPTCLNMVYIALTGKTDRDPASMCAFSQLDGHVSDGDTTWTLMSEGALKLGIASEELPADASALADALEAGHPVIASVGPGDFTTQGHFIVIAGVNDDGTLDIHDPNSPENSAKSWDADRVLNQCLNLWSFSVA